MTCQRPLYVPSYVPYRPPAKYNLFLGLFMPGYHACYEEQAHIDFIDDAERKMNASFDRLERDVSRVISRLESSLQR